jgi:hypothetical protein
VKAAVLRPPPSDIRPLISLVAPARHVVVSTKMEALRLGGFLIYNS